MDGTTNHSGSITKYTNLEFSHQGKRQTLPIYVTNLGRDRVILGLPWFKAFNPNIQWSVGKLTGKLQARTASTVTQINRVTQATEWAIQAEKDKKRLSEGNIPEAYQDYADVFSKEKAKRFPPKREEDHEIKLMENVPKSFDAHMYKMDNIKPPS